MEKLTKKQKRVFEFIEKYTKNNSYPPTFKDICVKYDYSIGTVQDYIVALVKKGYLEKKKDLARGFKLVKKSDGTNIFKSNKDYEIIPLYGEVAAGEPIFANDNIQGYISMEKNKRGHHIHFALKVKGDSMRDSGIYNGDIVVVKKQDSANDGDIIIALLDDEATVKTLRNSKIKAYLEASNSRYKSIVNKPFTIIGKVIELRRQYQLM
jgi:repressor LexA